jgi:CubicO group peptidase (beta-lactamase class C family)
VWEDGGLLRRVVCDFRLEWPTGSRVSYHPAAAHWALAAVIRAVTGEDHRAYLWRRVLAPLGLQDEVYVGLPPSQHGRAADMHDPDGAPRQPECSPAHRAAGVPGGGGYGTARGMAAFYQCLLAGGAPILSRRMVQYALRDRTGERVDEDHGVAMHRALGPHRRGAGLITRGLGTLAHPDTFGHGGVGSSYCWGDPDSGLSFAFLSNARQDEDFHLRRMDRLSNLAHAAIRPG